RRLELVVVERVQRQGERRHRSGGGLEGAARSDPLTNQSPAVEALPVSTTSKSPPVTMPNAETTPSITELVHPSFVSPLMYQFDPLSASSRPYFSIACRITFASALSPERLSVFPFFN